MKRVGKRNGDKEKEGKGKLEERECITILLPTPLQPREKLPLFPIQADWPTQVVWKSAT